MDLMLKKLADLEEANGNDVIAVEIRAINYDATPEEIAEALYDVYN